jgi:hypothetical protein
MVAPNKNPCLGFNAEGTLLSDALIDPKTLANQAVCRFPRSRGEYEDFVTGFVVDNGHVWGRPVGITVAQDGSLLVTDDGSNSIWRICYTGTESQKRASKGSNDGHAAKSSAK